MMDDVLKWIAEDIPHKIFWEVYFDLTKLDFHAPTAAFHEAAKRYISNNCNDFLQTSLQVCRDKSEENITRVMKLVTSRDDIYTYSDGMLIFFTDLLNTAPNDDATPSSSSSSSAAQVDTIISHAVDYIEKHGHVLTGESTVVLLRRFSSMCSNVESLQKIAKIQ